MRISREHFGHRSGSASHTFLINSRHFLEGMPRGSWAETSITSTASPSVCEGRAGAVLALEASRLARLCSYRRDAHGRQEVLCRVKMAT